MVEFSQKVRIVIEMKFPVIGTKMISIDRKDMRYVQDNLTTILENPYVVCVTVVSMKTYDIITMKHGPSWRKRDIEDPEL